MFKILISVKILKCKFMKILMDILIIYQDQLSLMKIIEICSKNEKFKMKL